MPTLLDNALKSKNMVLAFGGAITAAAVWTIFGSDMFPAEPDPKGAPETWTVEEMRRWLRARNLFPQDKDTRDELLARINANLRIPRKYPGMNLDDFYKWNPAVGNDCSKLFKDYYYCVGVPYAFGIRTKYHNDCTGDSHDYFLIHGTEGRCINTNCAVGSLDISPKASVPVVMSRLATGKTSNVKATGTDMGTRTVVNAVICGLMVGSSVRCSSDAWIPRTTVSTKSSAIMLQSLSVVVVSNWLPWVK